MVTNFEKYTFDTLTEVENKLLNLIVKTWNNKPLDEYKYQGQQIEGLNQTIVKWNSKLPPGKKKFSKLNDFRFRKIIHIIRCEDLIDGYLVAGGDGYCRTKDKEKIKKYIKSLGERERSFRETKLAMRSKAERDGLY